MDVWSRKNNTALYLWEHLTPAEALRFLSISSSVHKLDQPYAICAAVFALTRPHFNEQTATLGKWIRIWRSCVDAAEAQHGDASVWMYASNFKDGSYMASELYSAQNLLLQLDYIVGRELNKGTSMVTELENEGWSTMSENFQRQLGQRMLTDINSKTKITSVSAILVQTFQEPYCRCGGKFSDCYIPEILQIERRRLNDERYYDMHDFMQCEGCSRYDLFSDIRFRQCVNVGCNVIRYGEQHWGLCSNCYLKIHKCSSLVYLNDGSFAVIQQAFTLAECPPGGVGSFGVCHVDTSLENLNKYWY